MPIQHKMLRDATFRAFIAIELPENVRSKLREVQEQLREYRIKISWTRPENIHLTLKFLGDTKNEIFESLCGVIEEAANTCSPMKLYSQAIGVFPSVKRPRVLWTGIAGQTEALSKLQETLDIGLFRLGFPRETRSFRGHLTLGRPKGGGSPEQFIDIIKTFQDVATEAFTVDCLHLYKSKLLPSGPVYSKLFSAPVKAESSERVLKSI